MCIDHMDEPEYCNECNCKEYCTCSCHLKKCFMCKQYCGKNDLSDSITVVFPYGSDLDGSYELCSDKCLTRLLLSRGRKLEDVDLPPDND